MLNGCLWYDVVYINLNFFRTWCKGSIKINILKYKNGGGAYASVSPRCPRLNTSGIFQTSPDSGVTCFSFLITKDTGSERLRVAWDACFLLAELTGVWTSSVPKPQVRTGVMTQWVKESAAKPASLSSVHGTAWWEGRTDSHMCMVACMSEHLLVHTHAHVCMRAHTHTYAHKPRTHPYKLKEIKM